MDADPEAIQKIEFVGQLKNIDGISFDEMENMLIWTSSEKK